MPALQLDTNRQYGTLAHCIPPQTLRSAVTVDQHYLIGDSRSASELEVFINMPIERLRVGVLAGPKCTSCCSECQNACVLRKVGHVRRLCQSHDVI